MTACWPRAHPATGVSARLRAAAEDFRVTELAAFAPAGDGEHLFLLIEKTDLTTPAVAEWLAAAFAVPPVAVGYAGMKDRRAVTTQWFSVHTPRNADALPERAGVAVLDSARHRRKLRRGDLAGNRFRIRLTDVRGAVPEDTLVSLRDQGAPNYFGAQRFGADNLRRARDWLAAGRSRRLGAFHRGLHLSVLRSFLFNEVLAARVRDGSWNRALPGDVLVPLPVAAGPAGAERDLVPSGPLWGRGRPSVRETAAALEATALEPHAELCAGLEHAGVSQDRRSLVLGAPDLVWEGGGGAIELGFSLSAGGYATTLLAEAFDLMAPAGEPR